jgi:hypothetical protein
VGAVVTTADGTLSLSGWHGSGLGAPTRIVAPHKGQVSAWDVSVPLLVRAALGPFEFMRGPQRFMDQGACDGLTENWILLWFEGDEGAGALPVEVVMTSRPRAIALVWEGEPRPVMTEMRTEFAEPNPQVALLRPFRDPACLTSSSFSPQRQLEFPLG